MTNLNFSFQHVNRTFKYNFSTTSVKRKRSEIPRNKRLLQGPGHISQTENLLINYKHCPCQFWMLLDLFMMCLTKLRRNIKLWQIQLKHFLNIRSILRTMIIQTPNLHLVMILNSFNSRPLLRPQFAVWRPPCQYSRSFEATNLGLQWLFISPFLFLQLLVSHQLLYFQVVYVFV